MNNPDTSQKSDWEIIDRVMNNSRAPEIPPLLVNNVFVLNCGEKAKVFNGFFSKQCTRIVNSGIRSTPHFLLIKELIVFLYIMKKLSH